MTEVSNEQVTNPTHYTRTKYEVWDVADEWFPNDPHLWNVLKYVGRLGFKDDPSIEVGKIKAYLDRWLEKRADEQAYTTKEDA